MPLTLRPTGLVSPVYGHLQDWTIFEDGKPVGRIYEDVSERVVGPGPYSAGQRDFLMSIPALAAALASAKAAEDQQHAIRK
jgi:hypothetical protein